MEQQGRSGDKVCNGDGRKSGGKWRVGCALLPKKSSRYLTNNILQLAASNDIDVFLIDPSKPIEDQGPFDAIIHKLTSNKEWEHELLEFCMKHPEVIIVDQVDAIRPVQNRETMLASLGEGITLRSPQPTTSNPKSVIVKAPTQIVADRSTNFQHVKKQIEINDMNPPFLAKPLHSDGREGSHGLAVVHSYNSLQSLIEGNKPTTQKPNSHGSSGVAPPLVLQQFMEHGGVLFKIYVLGDQVVCMQRPSLKLQGPYSQQESQSGLTFIPRISCKPLNKQKSSTHVREDEELSDRAPPQWVVDQLGRILRERTGLQMFNVDLICPDTPDESMQNTYHVIDINYFPGFDKLPDFESRFVDFVRKILERGRHGGEETMSSSQGDDEDEEEEEEEELDSNEVDQIGNRRGSLQQPSSSGEVNVACRTSSGCLKVDWYLESQGCSRPWALVEASKVEASD